LGFFWHNKANFRYEVCPGCKIIRDPVMCSVICDYVAYDECRSTEAQTSRINVIRVINHVTDKLAGP
jgi:hypothetical protein